MHWLNRGLDVELKAVVDRLSRAPILETLCRDAADACAAIRAHAAALSTVERDLAQIEDKVGGVLDLGLGALRVEPRGLPAERGPRNRVLSKLPASRNPRGSRPPEAMPMTEPERCPRCNEATVVNGRVGANGRPVEPSSPITRSCSGPFGGLRSGTAPASRAATSGLCLNPSELRRFVKAYAKGPGRAALDEMDRGPYRDLPSNELSQEIGAHVAEIDALVRAGSIGKAVRRYRELRGVTWDQAIKDAGNWAELRRPAKLALFGWVPKKKESFDDLL